MDLAPVKGGKRHRLRLALTMAWRDIRRHKGRSGLIVALIALPIFAMSFAATAGMSMLATPAETAAMELGQTQGRLVGLPAQSSEAIQMVQGDLGGGWSGGEPDANFVPTAPKDAVPAGFTVIPWQSTTLNTPVGKADVELHTVLTDALNPAFTGKYTLLSGRAPTGATEALGTPGLLDRFGLEPGEKLTTSAGAFEIVGTLRVERQGDGESVLFLHANQIPAELSVNASEVTPYLLGERPLRWVDAKALNAKGVMLTSRSMIVDPPGKAELGENAEVLANDWRNGQLLSYILMGSLVGVLALLEVGLLAGAAFAVGARKQQRDLALLAASGAEGSMVRATVTAGGLWLGLAGGVIGAVLGTVAAAIVVIIGQSMGLALFEGLHLMWLPALGLVLLGVAAGLVAALVPARAVAKQATLAALKSGRIAETQSKWTPRIGGGLLLLAAVAMAGAGVVTLMVRGQETAHMWVPLTSGLIIAGAVMLVVGLICLTGRIIGFLTARTAWLPVSLRLAARDSARNRGRTVPAVAAVLAAATLSAALMVGAGSAMKNDSNNHQWQYNLNQTGVRLQFIDYQTQQGTAGMGRSSDPKLKTVAVHDVAALLKESLGPDTKTQLLRGATAVSQCNVDYAKEQMEQKKEAVTAAKPCPDWALAEPADNRCALAVDWKPVDLADWRCKGSMSNGSLGSGIPKIVVGGETELTALLGRAPSAATLKTLRDGGMVITNRIYLQPDNTTQVISFDPGAPENWNQYDPANPSEQFMRGALTPLSTHQLPAVVETPEKGLNFYGVVSPATAATLAMPVSDELLLVTAPHRLSPAETDKLQATLTPLLGQYSGLYFERGPNPNVGLILWLIVLGGALITLSAAGITAGLALADGRSDHATLASVGADTRLRKALSAAQTLMTAMLGTVLGVFAGAIPVAVALSLQRGLPVVVPWLQLGVLLVMVPLFGAAAAWVLTRGKLPMTRRQTLA